MSRLLLLSLALFAAPTFAQDVDGGDGTTVVGAPTPALVFASPDGGVADLSAPVLVKAMFTGVKEGNWWLVASAFLVLVVGLIRAFGKKFHDWLPDENVLDKPLWFIFDTKVGAWILNWLTAIAGGVGMALASGIAPDWTLWKSVLMVSTSASMLVELYKDIAEWIKMRQVKKAEEAAAKAAVVAPPPAAPGA